MISFKPKQTELEELYSKLIEDTEECRVSDKNYFFPDFIIASLKRIIKKIGATAPCGACTQKNYEKLIKSGNKQRRAASRYGFCSAP